MSQPFRAPPRTVSSGAHVDPSKLDDFRRNLPPRSGAASRSPPPQDKSPAGGRSPGPSSTPPPPPTMSGGDDDERQLPEGVRFAYDPEEFDAVRDPNLDRLLPDNVRTLAAKLWPEDAPRPENMWSRDMFSDKERVSRDRKLSNMVLGIMGRLTPDNFKALEKELFDLPIRQSTDEEITDVVRMMYMKAVNPADELYTELYAKLMANLVRHTGTQGVGKTIRKAIIDKCQQQFEQPFRLPENETVDDKGNPLADTEIEEKKVMLKSKLRANIKFLGHMFVSHMVNEKVVNFVLYTLLYGRDHERGQKRRPEEYELELFCDLLKKVVANLSDQMKSEYIPGYMKSLENLIPKVGNRIKFMLMDMKELFENGWVPKRRGAQLTAPSGPMTIDEFNKVEAEKRDAEMRQFEQAAKGHHRMGHHQASSPKTPAPREPQVPLPKKDLVYEVMEQFKDDRAPSIIEKFFKPIPARDRASYLQHWLLRIVQAVRREDERKMVGEVIAMLNSSSLIVPSEIERAVLNVATSIAVDTLYEDTPKIFQCWAEIINSCHNVVSQSAHGVLLRVLIKGSDDFQTSMETITKMVTTVLDAPDPNSGHRDFKLRFRPLPVLLQYAQPLPNPDVEAEDEEEEAGGEDDLLSHIIEAKPDNSDPEIAIFDTLANNISVEEVTNFILCNPQRSHPIFAAKIVCGIFTYVRCDTTCQQLDRLRQPLERLLSQNRGQYEPLLVTEAYLTYEQLGRQPQPSFKRFVNKLMEMKLIDESVVEAAQQQIPPSLTAEFMKALDRRPPGAAAQAAPGPRGGGRRR